MAVNSGNMKIFIGLLALAVVFTPIQLSYGANCFDKTCVDVLTADNQLVITAQKNGTSGVKKSATKIAPKVAVNKPQAPVKPVVKVPKLIALPVKPVAPKPVVKSATKPINKSSKKVATKKPATASLSDRLIKLLPIGDINYQPDKDPLVNIPIYFWSHTPTRFSALVPILDVVVFVNLTPTFTWSFGDGGFLVSKVPGSPYPIGTITHTYKSAGEYPLNLKITWNGTWSVNGISTPINGTALTQSISTKLSVAAASTKFIE